MKVKVDWGLPVQSIGQRTIDHQRRYYYTHSEYPCLLLVTHGRAIEEFADSIAVAFFGTPDSTIVCDVLPNAPRWWQESHLVQCTVKIVQKLPTGRVWLLSDALSQKRSKYKY